MIWDSEEWRKVRNEKFLEWFKGDHDAVDCLIAISTISETWDDLIDGDKDITPELINEVFVLMMVKLPSNRFYNTFRSQLEPIIIAGINAWMDSEDLQKRGDEEKDRMLAFYIRNYCAEVAQMIAYIIGGFEYMRAVSLEIRDFLNHETYYEWEHRHA